MCPLLVNSESLVDKLGLVSVLVIEYGYVYGKISWLDRSSELTERIATARTTGLQCQDKPCLTNICGPIQAYLRLDSIIGPVHFIPEL